MNTCPFCGEIKSNADWFKCGTSIYSPEYHRSDNCKDRQIAQLTEIRDAYRYLVNYPTDSKEHKDAEQKLRDLGEI